MRGFLTLEALLAMAIMLTTLSAVLLSTFGNASLLSDSARTLEARSLASALLAEEEARAEDDFNLVNPIASVTSGGYTSSTSVELLPDYLTKHVSAVASWVDEIGRTRSVTLTTLLTNYNDTTGDTCSSALAGDWAHPLATSAQLGTTPLAAGDISHAKLYAVASTTGAAANPTFFAYDISNPAAPTLLNSIDTMPSSPLGMSAVQAGGNYAYAAGLSACSKGTNCGQLQIVNVSDPAHLAVAGHLLLATSTAPFAKDSGGNPTPANTLFYKDGIAYLGLQKTSGGDEFNAIDVRDPANPVWLGGYAVGRGVNSIAVRSGYAYLATDDNTTGGKAVLVLDVRSPTNIVAAGGSFTASGAGFAKALAAVGSTLYLGRSYANGTQKEFYTLDAGDPTHALPALGSADTASTTHQASIRGLRVRDYLAFLLTTTGLEWWDMSGTTITQAGAAAYPAASLGTGIDCEGNTVYVLSASGSTSYLTALVAY
jgi:hypothetical protein